MGLGQAYCQREYRKYFNMTDKSMAGTMIIDYWPLLQSNEDNICTSLLLEGTQNEIQNETIIASVYKLFAAIRDILFQIETNNITIDNISPNQLDNTRLILSKLMQYRSYIEPNSNFNQIAMDTGQILEDRELSFGDFYENETIDNLVEELLIWQSQYKYMLQNLNVSTQLLQRIFTRSYFTMVSIDRSKLYTNVGEKINAYIIGFLNAVLVENAIENNFTFANLNTSKEIDKIFKNNVTALFQNGSYILDHLGLYQWIINCPLLKKFLNPFIEKIIRNDNIDTNWELYQYSTLRNRIISKIYKNKEIRNNIRNIDKAIQWIDNRSTSTSQTFINFYLDNNYRKKLIYLDKEMEENELQKDRVELIQKKEKFSILKYQNDEFIRNNRQKKKRFTGPIIRDYTQYKDDLSFYNYLCSIEIKESKVLNYDPNIDQDSL